MGIFKSGQKVDSGGEGTLSFFPDYSRAYAIYSGFVCPEPGWVVAFGANSTGYLRINNNIVAQGNWFPNEWSGNTNCQIIVDTGDVVTWDHTGSSELNVKFYTMKKINV